MADKYKIIGPVYDLLSTIYSGNQIHKSKTAMNADLQEDQKIFLQGLATAEMQLMRLSAAHK